MKKLLVNYTGKKGGGPEFAFEMTKALTKLDLEIYVIISKKVSNIHEWRGLKVKRLIEIDTYNNLIELFFIWLKYLFFNIQSKYRLPNRIDYIFVPMEQPLTKTINNWFKGAKVFLTIHDVEPHSGDNLVFRLFNGMLNYKIKNFSYKIILLSNVFIKKYSEKYRFNENNIIVLKHGLFNNISNTASASLPFKYKSKINFIFFGRISEYKGIDILLEGFYEYLNNNSEASLTIAGAGDIEKYKPMIKKIPKINIFNWWLSDGEIKSLFELPNSVLITPYRDASQSGVITLANLFHIPVISSNVGGLIEQVLDNYSGLLFNNGNTKELVSKMELIQDHNLATFLTNNAYRDLISAWDYNAKILFELMK